MPVMTDPRGSLPGSDFALQIRTTVAPVGGGYKRATSVHAAPIQRKGGQGGGKEDYCVDIFPRLIGLPRPRAPTDSSRTPRAVFRASTLKAVILKAVRRTRRAAKTVTELG